jgi:hypothetical protein
MMKASAEGTIMQLVDGRFRDDRWTADGRWDLSQFKDSKGEVDWDAVSVLHGFPVCRTLPSQSAELGQRALQRESTPLPYLCARLPLIRYAPKSQTRLPCWEQSAS